MATLCLTSELGNDARRPAPSTWQRDDDEDGDVEVALVLKNTCGWGGGGGRRDGVCSGVDAVVGKDSG